MIAGNDIAQCVPVIGRATEALRGKPGDFPGVRRAFKKAYQEQLREVVEDALLSPFAMTLDEFKKKGSKQLPVREFESISDEIRRADLGCLFLVFGFDDHKRPHLFVVENPGRVSVYDKPGFWAIGSGAPSALAMLSHMGQAAEASSFEETVYNVLAAKYISESADGVGKQTFFFVHEHNSIAFAASPQIESTVRDIWEKEGKPRMPATVPEIIKRADVRVIERPSPKKS
jgi:20S proteasome alpha/beta subunit